MTVILVDPRRPSLVPVEAVALLAGDVQYTEEMPVAGKGAARLRLDDPAGDAPTARWIYVIPLSDHLLLITVAAPKTTFASIEGELDRVLDGLVFRE